MQQIVEDIYQDDKSIPHNKASHSEILILILADLSTDYRCFKIATTFNKFGYSPTILCDKPLHPLGSKWNPFKVQILTKENHFQGFFKAWLLFHFRLTPILFRTTSSIWIIEDGAPLFWAALIGKIRGKNIIYDAREILLHTPAIQNRLSRFWLWAIWLKLGENFASSLLTVSPGFANYYRKKHPDKNIFLVPNVPSQNHPGKNTKNFISVMTDAKILPNNINTIKLIYTGALRPGSGLIQTIQAISNTPEYHLDIYGAGSEDIILKSLVNQLKLVERVKFFGSIPFEKLPKVISEAHIGLHLLESTCLSFDLTLSNKIFDYVHQGIPVLLSNTKAHQDFNIEAKIGIVLNSFESLDILNGLKEIRNQYSEFQLNCQKATEIWNWENFEPQIKSALAIYA